MSSSPSSGFGVESCIMAPCSFAGLRTGIRSSNSQVMSTRLSSLSIRTLPMRIAPTWQAGFSHSLKTKEVTEEFGGNGARFLRLTHRQRCSTLLKPSSAGADRLVRDYFAEPPMMLAKKVVLRRVPPREMTTGGWHQDGAFMGVGIRSLNIWLALSHCGDDAPGLDVVGRRFDELVEMGGEGTFNAWADKSKGC